MDHVLSTHLFVNHRLTSVWLDRIWDAGIPAVDLIDFSYRYADGLKDTIDKLSVASLDAVGETVFALVSELRAS